MIALLVGLCFAATLRFSDAARLCETAFTIAGPNGEDRLICITKAKNDTGFVGDWRALPARRDVPPGDLRCPVNLLEHVRTQGLGGRGLRRLFVDIKKHRWGRSPPELDHEKDLPYEKARQWIKLAFGTCPGVSDKDAKLAATHCCRIGSANANSRKASTTGGLNAAELNATGNWGSSRTAKSYDNAVTQLQALVAHPVWN
jgi:hypothetical protein